MTPAEEKARLASVQLALELLLARGPQTRAELFGKTKDSATSTFQRRVLHSLEQQGLVYKADAGTPPTTKVHLKNRKKAQYVLDNPSELAGIMWPSSKPAPPPELVNPPPSVPPPALTPAPAVPPPVQPAPQEPIVISVDDEESPQEMELRAEQAPVLAPVSDPSIKELLERLLVVMDAACQSIIYTREKVDAMEAKINYLWESLK